VSHKQVGRTPSGLAMSQGGTQLVVVARGGMDSNVLLFDFEASSGKATLAAATLVPDVPRTAIVLPATDA
jgi:hypothetical protein